MGERKVKVEIRIGRDEDGDWWTVLMVDGDEALWRGPHEHRAAAEKAGFNLAAEIDHLDDEAIRRIAERGSCQLDTETGFVLVRASRLSHGRGPLRTITKSGTKAKRSASI
jgi:hypothetical protein